MTRLTFLRELIAAFTVGLLMATASAASLKPEVRGLATRAPKEMKIDGDLVEFKGAFCTPINYFDEKPRDRAAQFLYMWDDEAFYAGLRTLDTKPANFAPDNRLWEGDGVEWYFDTRQDGDFRGQAWPTNAGSGAVHCYWVGLKSTNVQGRFCLRPGYLNAIQKIGIEVGSRRTKTGMEVEFKLPWANFPNFKPSLDAVIALDAELCYGDGDPDPKKWRVGRYFAYGSPLSVQQPASLGRIQLVDKLERAHWAACAPVMLPIRCDTPWTQKTKPHVTGSMAIPPDQGGDIGKIVFRVLGLDGAILGDFPGKVETFEAEGGFQSATAKWPSDLATPGAHHLLGLVYDKEGRELARVAPRMVSTGINAGY